MKPSVGSFPDPTTGQEVATKVFADEAYAGLHASRGDYIYASMSGDDTQGTPNPVAFDTVDSSRGEITLVANEFQLKAGRTYQLLASLQVDHGAPSSVNFNWYDATAAAVIGKESEALTTTASGINRSTQPVVGYIFTPDVDTLVHVRRVGGTANVTIESTKSWVMITEIGANVISAAGDYIHATLQPSTQSPGAGAPLDISTEINSRGQISVDGAGRFSGLRAGRTYKLSGWTRHSTNNPGKCQWRDITGGVYIGQWNITYSMNNTGSVSSQPAVIAIITPTVDTEVELWAVDGGMTFSDVSTHATIEEMGAVPASSKAIKSNLWYPPDIPHADDLEFDSEAIPVGWAFSPTEVATAIDIYAGFPSGGTRYDIHSPKRSWLRVQPAADAAANYLHKGVTIPTNLLMWARTCISVRNLPSPTNEDGSIGITISATDTGAPDLQNSITVWAGEVDAGNLMAQAITVESTVVQHNEDTTDLYGAEVHSIPWEYVAIHKLGSVYHFWVFDASGSKLHLGSRTYAGAAVDRVSVRFSNAVQTDPGNMVLGCDFVRFLETADFPF